MMPERTMLCSPTPSRAVSLALLCSVLLPCSMPVAVHPGRGPTAVAGNTIVHSGCTDAIKCAVSTLETQCLAPDSRGCSHCQWCAVASACPTMWRPAPSLALLSRPPSLPAAPVMSTVRTYRHGRDRNPRQARTARGAWKMGRVLGRGNSPRLPPKAFPRRHSCAASSWSTRPVSVLARSTQFFFLMCAASFFLYRQSECAGFTFGSAAATL